MGRGGGTDGHWTRPRPDSEARTLGTAAVDAAAADGPGDAAKRRSGGRNGCRRIEPPHPGAPDGGGGCGVPFAGERFAYRVMRPMRLMRRVALPPG